MDKSHYVIALGFFDGIHVGHARLLEQAKRRAAEAGGVPAILTFDTHPDNVVFGKKVGLINSAEDRIYIAKKYFDIDHVFLIHFNGAVMRMNWRDFLEDVMAEYSPSGFVVGYDFHFGYRGEGSPDRLQEFCREKGLTCDIIPQVAIDGQVVSSTYIRQLLQEGNMEEARQFLGHPYLLTDSVHSGHHIGHELDAPTINMLYGPEILVPRKGVYATWTLLPDGRYPAVTNVGVRPTFGGDQVTVESHIMDYSGDLYGKKVCLEFVRHLRDEIRFSSPDDLKRQIRLDADQALDILKTEK